MKFYWLISEIEFCLNLLSIDSIGKHNPCDFATACVMASADGVMLFIKLLNLRYHKQILPLLPSLHLKLH